MKKILLWLSIGVLTLSISACSEPIPAEVLDEQTMVNFLTEAYQLEGYIAGETGYRSEQKSAEVVRGYNDLFEKYNTCDTIFEKSIDYYMREGLRFQEIQQQVMHNLDSIENEHQQMNH